MRKICASMILVFSLIFVSSFTLASRKSAEIGNTDINIVLVHGIFGFKKIGSGDYFNDIEKHLEDKHNARVLVASVSKTGGIRERGNQLRQQIIHAINNPDEDPFFNADAPIHIIAHSMGGLDSRFILSPANPDNIANLIASLTTIGTPHKGSPLADLFFLGFNPMVDFSKPWVNVEKIMKSLSELGIEKMAYMT